MRSSAARHRPACSSPAPAARLRLRLTARSRLGTWGGENSGMIVSDTAMHLHVGCTYGDVSGRIPLSARRTVRRRRQLSAARVSDRDRANDAGSIRWARRRRKATVTVTVNDTVEHKSVVLGPVVVTWGTEPKMGPCPICRRPIVTQRRGLMGSDPRGILDSVTDRSLGVILAMAASRCRGEPQP